MREEFQTNMFCNIILGANIKNAIDDVGDYFNLSEEEKDTLVSCGDDEGARPGEGVLLIKGQKFPIKFEATKKEDDIIKGRCLEDEIPSNDGGIMVFPQYQGLVDDHKIIFSDWCQGDTSALLSQGYEKHKVQRVGGSGSMTAFIPLGMVENGLIKLPHLGYQTLDHYSSVVQLAGLLEKYGFEEIVIYHNQQVDISCKINGLKVAFEYENYNNKNLDIIIKKKVDALEKYDIVKFVSNSTDLPMITKAVGDKYCIKRGSAVTEFIESLTGITEYQNSEMVLGGIEPIAAL